LGAPLPSPWFPPLCFKAKLVALGFYPVGVCGADFAVYLRRQYDEYGRVIREANIRAE
jgi:hypothetical protein